MTDWKRLYEYEMQLRRVAEQVAFKRFDLLVKIEKRMKVCSLCHTKYHTEDCELKNEIASSLAPRNDINEEVINA